MAGYRSGVNRLQTCGPSVDTRETRVCEQVMWEFRKKVRVIRVNRLQVILNSKSDVTTNWCKMIYVSYSVFTAWYYQFSDSPLLSPFHRLISISFLFFPINGPRANNERILYRYVKSVFHFTVLKDPLKDFGILMY